MIRVFYNLVLRVFTGSVLLVCTAIFAGSLRYDPMIGLFTNPDGSRCEMPCLFGIRAGETTFEDVIILVQNHPMTHNLRLFEDDFATGLPTGRWGRAFHGSDWSILFLGQSGNVVALQIYQNECCSRSGIDYQYPVGAVCLRSVLNNGTMELPLISAELTWMWHRTSFLQMIATLGIPQSISSRTIAPAYYHFGSPRLESFYFEDQLVITHTNDTPLPPDFFRNFFDSVCLYPATNLRRSHTGFQGRSGAPIPWLGLFASQQDYFDWMAENPQWDPFE